MTDLSSASDETAFRNPINEKQLWDNEQDLAPILHISLSVLHRQKQTSEAIIQQRALSFARAKNR